MNPFTKLVAHVTSRLQRIPTTVGGIAKMAARRLGREVAKLGGSLMDLGDAITEGATGTPLEGQRTEAAFSHLIKTREKQFARLDPMEDVPSKLIIWRPLNENMRYQVTWSVQKYFPATGARINTYMSYYFDEDMVPEDWFAEMVEKLKDDPRYDMPFEVTGHTLALVQQNPNWQGPS